MSKVEELKEEFTFTYKDDGSTHYDDFDKELNQLIEAVREESQQQEAKEYDMRDRADIVLLAQRCAEHLTAQPLIDWFNKPKEE